LKTLDSGLAVIPDPDPGRNDKKWGFLTFYEGANIRWPNKRLMPKLLEGIYPSGFYPQDIEQIKGSQNTDDKTD